MKFGKNKRWNIGKPTALLLSLLLIFGVVAGGTLAYLFVSSNILNNSFNTVKVTNTVVETFDGAEKRNVTVKNTGEIDAWIRVALVPTWEDDNGNLVNQKASLSDLSISFNYSSWFEKNGYYYCRTKVAPGGSTPVLINTATVSSCNDYSMNLQILCEAIQAEPDDAVKNAWPVTVSNGKLA